MNLALISQPTTPNAMRAISALLSAVAKEKPNVGYIASQPDPNREYFTQTQRLYQSLNAQMSVYLELESGFNHEALNALLNCDVIHLSGGDTQRFLRSVKQRELNTVLKSFVKDGGAIVGVSAGAMLLTPSIASATLCGDVITDEEAALSAISLVNFQFVPHVTDEQLNQIHFKQQLSELKSPCYLCSDNDAVLQMGKELLLYGTPTLYKNPAK
ncbi:Type 1 glutamine amidotransferase-like domain-containing protein [Shewanella sp. 10N.286.45.A1]|uniref:Type 1 glutamine amidotransferase-like domain-containing protein n=1 Tax=Shewanella sp. 10N.286.45.A1 TaxID=3229694 RepID=UPI0035536CCE